MPMVAVVSFRLGHADGVSVVAAGWQQALERLGFAGYTVAGDGPVDRLVGGLAIGAPTPPSERELVDALAPADLVLVENLCTIPLNLPASRMLTRVLRGRAAILHHHDPPWQRQRFRHVTELPPDDAAWRHVTINELTRRQLADRGVEAITIYNGFAIPDALGDGVAVRDALGIAPEQRLVAHPVRAIPRKNVPAAVRLAEELGATYWLLGPAEDGYGPELARVLASARCPVVHHPYPGSIDDAYAAADAIAFPSTWEGFGNPPIEAALRRRPVAVGRYPVADELAAHGFRWFDPDDPAPLAAFLDDPDEELLEHNASVARRHFSFERMADDIEKLVRGAGWL